MYINDKKNERNYKKPSKGGSGMRSEINTAGLESILSVIEDDNRYIQKLNLDYRIKDNKFYIGCLYGDTFNTSLKKNYLEVLSQEVINSTFAYQIRQVSSDITRQTCNPL